jgi:hypothetical protein
MEMETGYNFVYIRSIYQLMHRYSRYPRMIYYRKSSSALLSHNVTLSPLHGGRYELLMSSVLFLGDRDTEIHFDIHRTLTLPSILCTYSICQGCQAIQNSHNRWLTRRQGMRGLGG